MRAFARIRRSSRSSRGGSCDDNRCRCDRHGAVGGAAPDRGGLSPMVSDKINPSRDIRITLVEGARQDLPALPESVSHSTALLLKGLDVDVRTGAKVNEVSSEGVRLEVRGTHSLEIRRLGRRGQGPRFSQRSRWARSLAQQPACRVANASGQRGSGHFRDRRLRKLPEFRFWPARSRPVPRRLHQQASHVFKQISRRLENKPLQPYSPGFWLAGFAGKYATVGSLMGFGKGKIPRSRGTLRC